MVPTPNYTADRSLRMWFNVTPGPHKGLTSEGDDAFKVLGGRKGSPGNAFHPLGLITYR